MSSLIRTLHCGRGWPAVPTQDSGSLAPPRRGIWATSIGHLIGRPRSGYRPQRGCPTVFGHTSRSFRSNGHLLQRKLDIVSWASGLPAFGPEALIVQLAARPSSFHPWADLVAHLGQLVGDCDDERLATLLADQLPKIKFERAGIDHGDPGVWMADYHLLDRLVAPLQLVLGKA